MAKIEQLEPRTPFREHWAGTATGIWRRPVMPAINWGSVIAGVAVGLSVQMVLALFGLASGLAVSETEGAAGTGIGALIWSAVSMLAAAFVAGFVAARMSGLRRKTDGLLHGAVSWAVATLMLAALSGYAGGILPGLFFNGMLPDTVREVQADDNRLPILLRGMIGGDMSVADMQTLEHYIHAGQREEATLLLGAVGMDPIQAATVVDQAIIFAGTARRDATQGIASLPSSGIAAWTVFGGMLLALLLGMTGGLVGAMGARRQVWSRPDSVGGKEPETSQS